MTYDETFPNLSERCILMQGAGRTPGPALIALLSQCGAQIAACDLSPVLIDPLAALPGVTAYTGDYSRGMPARSLFDEALSGLTRLDVLILNPRVRPTTALLDMDEWDWQRTIEVNLHGAFLQMQLGAKQMIEQNTGGVILALVEDAGSPPGGAAYAAALAGVNALMRTAEIEFLPYNIVITTVCLSSVDAPTPTELMQIAHLCAVPQQQA